jgi:hypothetical protein
MTEGKENGVVYLLGLVVLKRMSSFSNNGPLLKKKYWSESAKWNTSLTSLYSVTFNIKQTGVQVLTRNVQRIYREREEYSSKKFANVDVYGGKNIYRDFIPVRPTCYLLFHVFHVFPSIRHLKALESTKRNLLLILSEGKMTPQAFKGLLLPIFLSITKGST